MSYQQRSGTQRGFDRPKKVKSKKATTHHSTGMHREENGIKASNDIVERTLTALETLGSQIFATAPFHQHLEIWLKSLQTVVDDFESSHVIEADDKFRDECQSLIKAIEGELKAEQAKEASRWTTINSIHGSEDLLIHAEKEHGEKLREQASRRDRKLKELTANIEKIRTELDDIQESKTGFLEGITKRKAKSEQETSSRFTTADKKLDTAKVSFTQELTQIQEEYEQERKLIMEKVATERREIDLLVSEAEIDGSIEARRTICEEFSKAVKSLVERLEASTSEKTESD